MILVARLDYHMPCYVMKDCVAMCVKLALFAMLQIMQPDLDEGVHQQPVVSGIYDRHKATLGDTLG